MSFFKNVLSSSWTVPTPWNVDKSTVDEIIPCFEALYDFGPIGSGRPRKDSGYESDERLYDYGPIGGSVIKTESKS